MDREKKRNILARKARPTTRYRERGQISLMIGLMVGTFVLIFLFVINAGILINARINLQNAADMAAYAGAATQARQLNLISMLNYEMRRQYKKFLFRYYVMGAWGYDDSPQRAGAGNSENREYRTGFLDPQGQPIQNSGTVLGAPLTCFDGLRYIVDPATGKSSPENVCRNVNFAKISSIDAEGAFAKVMNSQANAINAIIQNNCGGLALRNLDIINKWLWNIDPSFEILKSELERERNNPANKSRAEAKLVGLSQLGNITRGIGLFPMNLFLQSRIQQIADYVNQPAERLNLSAVKAMETSSDPFKNERSIQAFYSAYRSLGEHSFSNDEEIVLEEILPTRLLDLEFGKTSFTVFPLIFSGSDIANTAVACKAEVLPFPVLGLPVAISKKPSTMTYYAVRLKGRARLLLPPGLFSSNEFEMEAYAAAQPFGSRIGPVNAQSLAENEFRQAIDFRKILGGQTFGANQMALTTGLPAFTPWLPVADSQSGWEKAEFQRALYQSGLLSIGAQELQNSLPDLSGYQLEQAYEVAMMPNPVESGRYNIMHWPRLLESGRAIEVFDRRFVPHIVKIDPPVDPGDLSTINPTPVPPPGGSRRMEPGTLQTEAAAYWSPIASLSGGADISAITSVMDQKIEEFRAETKDFIQKTGSATGAGGADFEGAINQSIDLLKQQMPQFLQNLDQFVNHTGQGLTYQVFRTPFPPFGDSIAQQYPQYFMTTLPQIRTSWVNQRHRRITESGRSGYSVKFVSFDYLQRRPANAVGGGAQGTGPWTNGLMDSELTAAGSASPVKH